MYSHAEQEREAANVSRADNQSSSLERCKSEPPPISTISDCDFGQDRLFFQLEETPPLNENEANDEVLQRYPGDDSQESILQTTVHTDEAIDSINDSQSAGFIDKYSYQDQHDRQHSPSLNNSSTDFQGKPHSPTEVFRDLDIILCGMATNVANPSSTPQNYLGILKHEQSSVSAQHDHSMPVSINNPNLEHVPSGTAAQNQKKTLPKELRDQKQQARKDHTCVWCRSRKIGCKKTGSTLENPCEKCNEKKKFCYRPDRSILLKLTKYDLDPCLRRCREISCNGGENTSLDMVLVIRARPDDGDDIFDLYTIPQSPENVPIALRKVDSSSHYAQTNLICDVSGINVTQMDNFVESFSASVIGSLGHKATCGEEQPFQSAKKCLRYLVVLQRLPYAAVKMQRSLQYQVVSALLQRIIISLMTHLEESMTKIVPVLLPTERNKNKKVRQDFAVMALAVVIHVTESLANLHGSASMDVQNTFEVLADISEAARSRVPELYKFGYAVHDSIPSKEEYSNGFRQLVHELVPNISELFFEIACSSSNLLAVNQGGNITTTPNAGSVLFSSFSQDSWDAQTVGKLFPLPLLHRHNLASIDGTYRSETPPRIEEEFHHLTRQVPSPLNDSAIDTWLLNSPNEEFARHVPASSAKFIIRQPTLGPNDQFSGCTTFQLRAPDATHQVELGDPSTIRPQKPRYMESLAYMNQVLRIGKEPLNDAVSDLARQTNKDLEIVYTEPTAPTTSSLSRMSSMKRRRTTPTPPSSVADSKKSRANDDAESFS